MEIVTEITIDKLDQHLIDVKIIFTSPYDSPIMEMPQWTPGSYLIREYARHVQNFTAYDIDHSDLENHKLTTNSWEINAIKGQKIIVKYEVYAFELTVRTSYLDNRKCLIIPASVCMYITNQNKSQNTTRHSLKLNFNYPANWKLFTSLKKFDNYYFAQDFDDLVDSPIAIAKDTVINTHQYVYNDNEVDIPNTVVFIGDQIDEDLTKFSDHMKKLQDNSVTMFGRLPYDRYLWMVFVTESHGGGLEHKYSNASIIPRYSFNDPKKYAKILSLEAHEHFHTYNIKRIRPKQLGPFDYSSEVYTKLLWIAEGLTSFYDNIILPRSGLISRKEYWKIFSDDLSLYFQKPGRLVDSLESSSFDAWIKLYRPNENSVNSTISYYLKGGIVGFMLDLEIRRQTEWISSLDTFYSKMYQKYLSNKTVGYEEKDIKKLIETTTNTNLDEFWKKYIAGIEEIDIDFYLNLIGMKLIKESSNDIPYTGIKFSNKSTIISNVYSNSPAEDAGIYAFDEIVAINGFKVSKSNIDKVLKNYTVGNSLEIHLFRDSKLLITNLTLKEPLKNKIKIDEIEDVTNNQKANQDLFFYNYDKTLTD
ncbi:MAG: M61 family metallopeptidase [Candidatus Heimdallarchaeota archaeon]|nr:M61 family metallopeptidase [Candidatus Heimdallarchaeota archaeon]